LEKSDPGLEIEKFVLVGGGDPTTLEGDFKKSLALGSNKFI
jgi:hypothetical protein